MPRQDRTGPEGKGPKTGRGLGPCNDVKDILERKQGRGFFRRGNRNQGWRGFRAFLDR